MALKIIDLDIDEALSAVTRVEEVGFVFQPAIETEFIYFTSQEFEESITDYPQYITDTAIRAKKWVEENGYGSCMTPVGKARLNQLANREPLSILTLKRMKAYGSRHKKDWDSSKSFDEGCGYLAMASWGFEPSTYDQVMNWLENQITKNEEMDYVQSLPQYTNYATGDTKNNMLIEPIEFIEKIPYERRDEYIQRCVEWHIKNKGWSAEQSYAVCISQAEEAFLRGERVSFDWDDTLSTQRGYGLALHERNQGSELYIISARRELRPDVLARAEKIGIPKENIYMTGSNLKKIETIKRLKIRRHYDNNDEVIDQLPNVGVQFSCGCLDEFAKIGERGGVTESRKAPKSDTPNPNPKGEGTAKGDAGTTRGAEVTERVEKILKEKSDDFNERYKDKLGYGVNVGMLKSVYQRGIGAYNVSHSPEVKSGEQWALARVNAFLYLVKEGRPENKKYVGDNDLLPKEHPKSEKQEMSEQFNLVGFIDGEPLFSTPVEAETYGENIHGCSGHHVHIDENGNEVYMACSMHPTEEEFSFGVDDYTEEEIETVKLLKFLAETNREEFEAVVGAMRGATETELKRRNHKNLTIYFKYERVLSGAPDRDFCTSIEGRYFRRLEIDLLRDVNREFGHERQPYSKWLYKGGPNCVHAWRRYYVQGENISDQGMVEGTPGIPPKSLPNNGYYSKETKRKSEVAYIISQQNMSKQQFKSDDEKRMIYSPLMLPNVLIPRMENGEKYFVRFTPESIEKIQRKFMIEQRLRSTNLEHSNHKFNDVVMVESWIVSGDKDKAYQLGFTKEQVPIGSWMGGYKILDTDEGDIIWNDYIKSGKVKGLSVEGEFLLKFSAQKFNKYDIVLEKIINILEQVEE